MLREIIDKCILDWCFIVFYRHILVYRLGGISCDATVLYVNAGLVSIVASEHTKAIGGYKLIETLKAHLIEEVKRYFIFKLMN